MRVEADRNRLQTRQQLCFTSQTRPDNYNSSGQVPLGFNLVAKRHST